MRGLLTALSLAALAGCASAVEGRLVDRDTGRPITGAEVLQVYRSGVAGEETQILHARWAETDREGRFTFPAGLTNPRAWIVQAYGPRYDFHHPDYGLVRGPTTESASVELEGSLSDARQRRMDLEALCHSSFDDPQSRRLRETACTHRIGR